MDFWNGEGEDNALGRLQRAIAGRIPRIPVPHMRKTMMTRTANSAPFFASYLENPPFVGRESQLAELEGYPSPTGLPPELQSKVWEE